MNKIVILYTILCFSIISCINKPNIAKVESMYSHLLNEYQTDNYNIAVKEFSKNEQKEYKSITVDKKNILESLKQHLSVKTLKKIEEEHILSKIYIVLVVNKNNECIAFKITTPHEFGLNDDDLKGIRSVLLNEQFTNPNNTLYKIEFSIKILE